MTLNKKWKFKIEVVSKKPLRAYGWDWLGRIWFSEKEYESFTMGVYNWDIKGYQHQWKAGIERIKTHDSSCLVTSFSTNRKTGAYIWMYKLYKVDTKIYIQQRLLINESVEDDNFPPLTEFTSKNCYSYVGPRSENVWEKEISVDDL